MTKTTLEYLPTAVPEVNHVLSGGLVAGQVIDFIGFPGAGKTRLSIQMLNRRTLYATMQESIEEIGEVAEMVASASFEIDKEGLGRLVLNGCQTVVCSETVVEEIIACATEFNSQVIVLNSLVNTTSRTNKARAGHKSQMIAVTEALKEHCQMSGRIAILLNEMTRDGDGRVIEVEHIADTLLALAYPRRDDKSPAASIDDVRLLCVEKNRYGHGKRAAYLSMSEGGRLISVEQQAH